MNDCFSLYVASDGLVDCLRCDPNPLTVGVKVKVAADSVLYC